jgi:hypothetical protein
MQKERLKSRLSFPQRYADKEKYRKFSCPSKLIFSLGNNIFPGKRKNIQSWVINLCNRKTTSFYYNSLVLWEENDSVPENIFSHCLDDLWYHLTVLQ